MNITEYDRWSNIPVYPSNNMNVEKVQLRMRDPKDAYTTRQSIYDANMHQKNKTYTIMSAFKGTDPMHTLGRLYGEDPQAEWSVKHHLESNKTRPASKCRGANCIPDIIKLHSKNMADATMELNLRRLNLSTARYDYAPQRLE